LEQERRSITKTWRVGLIKGMLTTAAKTRAASISNKSAITDHMCNKNHVTDWDGVKVIDQESDKTGRLIREVLCIRRSSNMNQDEGSYQLRHVWDKLLTDVRNQKSVLMKTSDHRLKHHITSQGEDRRRPEGLYIREID